MGACCIGSDNTGSSTPKTVEKARSHSLGGEDQDSNKPRKKSAGSKKNRKASESRPKKSNLVGLFQFCESPRRRIPTRTYSSPILYQGTKVIFLSGELIRNDETGDLEAQYLNGYYIKDLRSDEIEEKKINCGDTQIDILPTNNACVYALNPENNKIYFIVNNRQIMTLDLSDDTLKSLDKEISDIEGTDNLAQIGCLDGKICIMGPENITNNDDEKDGDYVYKVPYKLGNNQGAGSGDRCKFVKYGQLTRVINAKVNDKNHILMMGGVRFAKPTKEEAGKKKEDGDNDNPDEEAQPEAEQEEEPAANEEKKQDDDEEEVLIPHDEIFVTDGEAYRGFGDAPDKIMVYHTRLPMHSFGIVNYKDEYLFQFGGIEGLKNGSTEKSKGVHVARIKDVDTKNKKDEYDLERFRWYSLEMKIPKLCLGFCHALYIPELDCIELFNYFGKHFRFPAKVLFDQLKNKEQQTVDNPKPKNENDKKMLSIGWKQLNEWTQEGKTVNPTKSTSVTNLGPALDSEVDTMLRKLGNPYSNYVNVMNDFPTFKDVANEANLDKLKGIIKDQAHLQTIIDTAKSKIPKKEE